MPEALFWRVGDHENVGLSTRDMEPRGGGDGKRRRYSYTYPDTLDRFRTDLARWEANAVPGNAYGRKRIGRLRELIAVGEAWQAERDAAYEAAGCVALDRAYNQETERWDTLALQIAAIPARTSEGVCAKVRAITAVECWNVDTFKDGRLGEVIAHAEANPDERSHALLLSVILDAGTLIAPVAAGEAA